MDDASRADGHILRELGFSTRRDGEDLRGSAEVTPEMWVPGTQHLRTSILAAWADVAAGYLVVDLVGPRVPVTLELEVHAYAPTPGRGAVHTVARTVKAGRSVVVLGIDVVDGRGEPIAMGTASFMTAPDPNLRLPPDVQALSDLPPTGRLTVPFADRAGCERRAEGVAALPRTDDGLNSAQTVNGGLVALAVEEAVLSASAPGATVASMALRYLRAVRVGPAVATASLRAGLGRVEVRDEGQADRLAVVATTRTFPA